MLLVLFCFTIQWIHGSIVTILHFSDVHLNEELHTASYGSDSSIGLLESAISYANHSVLSTPDVFLYTGDYAAHATYTPTQLENVIQQNVKMMEKYYRNQTKLIPAIIGNTDCTPRYSMKITNPQLQENPDIQKISAPWKRTLTKTEYQQFNRKGYLSYQLQQQLFLISLNTIPYSVSHQPKAKETDPFGQFEWLNATLQSIQQQSAKVLIVGHIPPIVDSYGGAIQWRTQYLVQYRLLVDAYKEIIVAQLFGHIHSLEYRIALSENDIVPLFTTGAISPKFGNNPTFTVWKYDTQAEALVDFSVHVANISSKPSWSLLFEATSAYNLTSLNTGELRNLSERMKTDDTLFQRYYRHTRGNSLQTKPCSSIKCKASVLCTQKWYLDNESYHQCVQMLSLELLP